MREIQTESKELKRKSEGDERFHQKWHFICCSALFSHALMLNCAESKKHFFPSIARLLLQIYLFQCALDELINEIKTKSC